MKIRTLIVDDEYESRQTLGNFLRKYCPEIVIIAEAGSVTEALSIIEQQPPELVFLDINMPDENGFQLLVQLPDIEFYTVFVTAYDEFAIQAIKHHAVDYLLKPIDIQELKATVHHISQLRKDRQHTNAIKDLLKAIKPGADESKIALPVTDGFIYVRAASIVRCEARDNYTQIYFEDGKKTLVSRTLAVYEELLKDKEFCRVHHQHLINLQHVERYIRGRGGIIMMSDKKEIQVSQRRKEVFLKSIGNIRPDQHG